MVPFVEFSQEQFNNLQKDNTKLQDHIMDKGLHHRTNLTVTVIVSRGNADIWHSYAQGPLNEKSCM